MREKRFSRTAHQIAATVIYRAVDPRIEALLPRDAAELTRDLLGAAGLLKPRHLALLENRWYRRLAAGVERRTADGQSLNIVLRKRFIDDETRAAVADGATQVLVLGGGFDTLVLRLARRFPEVEFFEIDHPATQSAKLRGVEELEGGYSGSPNLHFIAADLAVTSLAEVLGGNAKWRPEEASVVIAEGLLMYLELPAVATFLETARAQSGTGSRLIFTFMRRDRRGRIYIGKQGIFRHYFELIGEPLLWGVRDEDELAELLARHGWRLAPPQDRDMRARYLVPSGLGDEPLGGVEFMAVADQASGQTNATQDREKG